MKVLLTRKEKQVRPY